MMRAGALVLALALSGCTAVAPVQPPVEITVVEATLPPTRSFSATRPQPPARSNANIAADFLSLHFELESGSQLPVFTRFETPVTVRLTGQPTDSMQADLTRLLGRLRREAGIDISQIREGQASITIQAVSQRDIHRILPQAACFVVPNASSLEEYSRDRRKAKSSWTELRQRQRLGIFIPYDASPQEIRDCLHEELAQALGPLNDLYRLPDSVFNDDNIHTILTGFDMLILRTAYAPELRSGMSRDEVAAELPGILSRLNPRGNRLPTQPVSATTRQWINAIQKALGPRSGSPAQMRSAQKAAEIAARQGWTDHRRAYPHYLLGRMEQFRDPDEAQRQFRIANEFLKSTPGTEVHQAYVTAQTAVFALAQEQGPSVIPQLDQAIGVMERAQNASLLATLLLLKSEALLQAGEPERARRIRLDSLGWARYGFGSDVVRSLLQDAAARAPQEIGENG